jgi:hypothetical protein
MRIAKAKACPFCKSDDSFVERMNLSSWARVCNECFCHGPDVCDADWDEDKGAAEATRAWNRRARRKTATATEGNS